jgi:hypothetical protein
VLRTWFFQAAEIMIAASGSRRHAGITAEVLIERLSGIPFDVEYTSEYEYPPDSDNQRAAVKVISQSGETSDTLAGSVALTPSDALWLLLNRSGWCSEDFEQLIDEAYLVLDTRLTGKTMSSPDHPHHFESFNRGGGRLHRLKVSRRANDSLERTMVGFNDAVHEFAGTILGRS